VFFVYILQSESTGRFYVGQAECANGDKAGKGASGRNPFAWRESSAQDFAAKGAVTC